MKRSNTVRIGEVLEEFFKRPYVAAKLAEGHLPDYWREVVGVYAADHTIELRLDNHILHVRMASSVLRQELFYHREDVMARLNTRAGMRLVNAIIVR